MPGINGTRTNRSDLPSRKKPSRDRVSQEDFSLLHKSRMVNLQKLYPYIPTMLNNILRHFSSGAHVFYESVDEITEDLEGYLASI